MYTQRILAFTALLAMAALCAAPASAKVPGHTYCFNGICHRVQTLAETSAQIGQIGSLSTSHYDDCSKDRFNPCGLTSSGTRFRPDKPDNAASPHYPNGTVVLVWNPPTRKAAVLRIDNAGPYYGKRKLDVSRAAAEALGFAKRGVATLQVEVLSAPTKAEATYKRNRIYAAVPGDLGVHASIKDAQVRYAALVAPAAPVQVATDAVGGLRPVTAAEGQPASPLLGLATATTAGTVTPANGMEKLWVKAGTRLTLAGPRWSLARVSGKGSDKLVLDSRKGRNRQARG
jgi:rare lipoprotein A